MPEILHELIIGAPAERIYQAITSREGLSAWWTPDTDAQEHEGTIARFPFGPTYFKEMNIVKVTPSTLVQWHCVAGAEEWVGTDLSFTLESGEKETLLNAHPEIEDQIRQCGSLIVTLVTFQHTNWKNYSPMYAECNYTWGQFLRSLKLFCESGKGTPWPEQHRSS